MQRTIDNEGKVEFQGQVKLISNELRREILRTGIVCVAEKGHGKSNALKCIARELLGEPNISLKVFDSSQNWIWSFPDLPYQLIGASKELEHISEGIYDLSFMESIEKTNYFISALLAVDWHYAVKEKFENQGRIREWVVYVVEEGQSVIGRSINDIWLRTISEGRNFGVSAMVNTQRLADVSTKVVERCGGYLFGRLLGDNDKRKVRGIAGKRVAMTLPSLEVGQFIYYNGESTFIEFPKFKDIPAMPYRTRRSTGILQSIKNVISTLSGFSLVKAALRRFPSS